MTLYRLLMIIISLICTSIGISSLAQSAEQFMSSQPKYSFIENKGQVTDQYHNPNEAVKFILPLPNNNIVLRATGFSYDTYVTEERERKQTIHGGLLKKHEELEKDITFKYHRVDVVFQGANPKPEIIAEGKSTDYSNYYVGASGKEVKVYHYGKIIYKDVYPGIDVEFLARPGSDKPVEYNFIVHPGADMDQIRLRYKGATESKLVDDKLELTLAHGKLTESIPESYWQKSKNHEEIRYKRINAKSDEITVGFVNAVSGRQMRKDEALIIDPTPFLEWGTYYGGGGEVGMSIALDGSGNILVTGVTFSVNRVATEDAHQTSLRGFSDSFIVKFNSAKLRQWCTYYGGTGNETAYAIAVDVSGNVFVGGETSSADYIANTAAHQIDYGGGVDAFLVKFDSEGMRLWGTYYGGSGWDGARSITIDNSSNVLVAGWTSSDDLVTTTDAHQTSYAGGGDAFIVKFNSSGGQEWATYYGDIGSDQANSITADGSGNTYFGGTTTSQNSIAINTTHQPNMVGTADAFIVKLNSQGAPQWGTYYGGDAVDEILSMTSNPSGDIFITGKTSSTTLLASSEAYQTTGNDGSDGFVAKFSSSGSQYWSTFYGGVQLDIGTGISIDSEGNSYVVGEEKMSSGDFVRTFIAKFSPIGTFQWHILHGGSDYFQWVWGNALVVDPYSNIYVIGSTDHDSLIATPDAYQPATVGGQNAYISKYNSCRSGNATATELNCDICAAGTRCQDAGTTQFTSTISNGTASWSISDDNPAVSNSISPTGLVTWDPSFTGQATITLTVTGCGDPVIRNKTITVNPVASASGLSCDICTGTPPTRCQASGTTPFTSSIVGTPVWSISDNNPEVSNGISATGLVTWDPAFSGGATITLTVTGCGSPVIRTKTITRNSASLRYRIKL